MTSSSVSSGATSSLLFRLSISMPRAFSISSLSGSFPSFSSSKVSNLPFKASTSISSPMSSSKSSMSSITNSPSLSLLDSVASWGTNSLAAFFSAAIFFSIAASSATICSAKILSLSGEKASELNLSLLMRSKNSSSKVDSEPSIATAPLLEIPLLL